MPNARRRADGSVAIGSAAVSTATATPPCRSGTHNRLARSRSTQDGSKSPRFRQKERSGSTTAMSGQNWPSTSFRLRVTGRMVPKLNGRVQQQADSAVPPVVSIAVQGMDVIHQPLPDLSPASTCARPAG